MECLKLPLRAEWYIPPQPRNAAFGISFHRTLRPEQTQSTRSNLVLKQSEDLLWRGFRGGSDRRGLSCRIEEYALKVIGQRASAKPTIAAIARLQPPTPRMASAQSRRNCRFASKRRVVIGLPGSFGLRDVDRAKLVAGMVAHAYQPSGEIVSAGLQTDQHVDRAIKASLHILKGMGYLVSTLSVVQS